LASPWVGRPWVGQIGFENPTRPDPHPWVGQELLSKTQSYGHPRRVHEQTAQIMCFYHDQIAHLTFRDMHSINLSFESVQRSQHDYAEKIRKERLYDFEIV
jgi:hypothetical protein